MAEVVTEKRGKKITPVTEKSGDGGNVWQTLRDDGERIQSRAMEQQERRERDRLNELTGERQSRFSVEEVKWDVAAVLGRDDPHESWSVLMWTQAGLFMWTSAQRQRPRPFSCPVLLRRDPASRRWADLLPDYTHVRTPAAGLSVQFCIEMPRICCLLSHTSTRNSVS